MASSIKVEGIPQLRRALLTISGEGQKTAQREVKRALVNIQSGAKRRAPVGTPESTGVEGYIGGRLRNSIAHETTENGLGGRAGTNVEYAKHVHFGTGRRGSISAAFLGLQGDGRYTESWPGMPARPFLFQAYEEEWPKFVARLRKKLGESFVREV
jgi:HK97 gp10 family phage protein